MSPSRSRARRTLARSRRTWLAIGATVLGGAGLATAAVAAVPDEGSAGTDPARPASAQTMAFGGTGKAERDLPRTRTEDFSLIGVSWADHTRRFDGTAQVRTRSAETGRWSEWRDLDFDTVAPETDETRAADTRGASEPLWTGPSDAVEARVLADGEQRAVPEGLRLDLIDPGTTPKSRGRSAAAAKPGKDTATPPTTTAPAEPTATPSTTAPADPTATPPTTTAPEEPTATPSTTAPEEPTVTPAEPSVPAETPTATPEPTEPSQPTEPTQSSEPTDSAEPSASPTDTAPATPSTPAVPAAPSIVSRAGWGADESLVKDPAEYLTKVEAVFVHHTAGTNDYSCADSPAIIRAIFVYHVQTNGWNDVGYNFFVDQCGTVFEGRAGGVDRRVRGAHTYGFNGVSSGISLLGDYENGGTPTPAALSAIADVAAWKLGLDGVDPQARVTLTAAGDTGVYKAGERANLYTVSGHRDGYATLCPGQKLYDELPALRARAAASPYAAR
ncbi:N-acetylmuramoyl-L-alanine amidase [Streptomyces sp. NPDC001595]|uniref:peptidoglycan recognition protein family protein n=1 Tax=Streptomyces sp. NPDC001532 TaxID=3154520 RepID=UPI003332C508